LQIHSHYFGGAANLALIRFSGHELMGLERLMRGKNG
jgi:hypothetical protein